MTTKAEEKKKAVAERKRTRGIYRVESKWSSRFVLATDAEDAIAKYIKHERQYVSRANWGLASVEKVERLPGDVII